MTAMEERPAAGRSSRFDRPDPRPYIATANASSWHEELKAYENERRRNVDEGLLRGPQLGLNRKMIKAQERLYDPLLQRYRDDATEQRQRDLEERERVKHLNRALDVQILRERHPEHLIHHESRLEAIEDKTQPVVQQAEELEDRILAYPTTAIDYNILSNLPFDVHHFNRPEDRPRHVERSPKGRRVHAHRLRDFNILTTRYNEHHEERIARDQKLNRLELTHKYQTRSRFNPVTQTFTDPKVEERAKTCDDARDQEIQMRAEHLAPVHQRGRHTAYYDMVTHKVHDDDMLDFLDTVEDERKVRFKTRYQDDHDRKLKEMQFEDLATYQKHDNVHHERWEETTRRGYHIINNRPYGKGERFEPMHEPYTKPSQKIWEKVLDNRTGLTPPGHHAGRSMPEVLTMDAQPAPNATLRLLEEAEDRPHRERSRHHGTGTPRAAPSPRTLSEAGAQSLGGSARQPSSARQASSTRQPISARQPSSARGAVERGHGPPLMPMESTIRPSVAQAPPPPAIPGSPVGSVYSRPKR